MAFSCSSARSSALTLMSISSFCWLVKVALIFYSTPGEYRCTPLSLVEFCKAIWFLESSDLWVRAPYRYLRDLSLSLDWKRTLGIDSCLCFFCATSLAKMRGISLFLSGGEVTELPLRRKPVDERSVNKFVSEPTGDRWGAYFAEIIDGIRARSLTGGSFLFLSMTGWLICVC